MEENQGKRSLGRLLLLTMQLTDQENDTILGGEGVRQDDEIERRGLWESRR
jgi:hypothetical protein